MKKINSAFLLAAILLVQAGYAQTASSGKSLTADLKSNNTSYLSWLAQKGEPVPEKGSVDRAKMSTKSESTSQLDSVTIKMTDAAIKQLSKQGEVSLDRLVRKTIDDYLAEDRDITPALDSVKRSTF